MEQLGRSCGSICVALLTWLIAADANAKVALSAIVAEKDVPAAIPDGKFAGLGGYFVAGSGEIVFSANVTSNTAPVDDGVWHVARDGKAELLLNSGAKLPDHDDITVDSVYVVHIDAGGRVAVLLDNWPARNMQRIVLQTAGGFEIVAETGQTIPGSLDPAPTFGVIRDPVYTSSGVLAFVAQLQGAGVEKNKNDFGIWIWNRGELHQLMRNGDPAPGIDL